MNKVEHIAFMLPCTFYGLSSSQHSLFEFQRSSPLSFLLNFDKEL